MAVVSDVSNLAHTLKEKNAFFRVPHVALQTGNMRDESTFWPFYLYCGLRGFRLHVRES